MNRLSALIAFGLVALTACTPVPQSRLGPDGLPLPRVYRIDPANTAEIQFRMLDGVNALRQAAGVPPLALNAQLNASAATHSRDMSVQNRPWLFSSDGASQLETAERVGYTGSVLGANISETYETETETLAAWMSRADTRSVILDPRARQMGFAWFQEPSGKLWWTLIVGTPEAGQMPSPFGQTTAF